MSTTPEIRELLAAIRDALDIPYPADGTTIPHDMVIADRAAHIVGVLGHVAEGGDLGPEARIIREHAAHPLPYQAEGSQS